MAPGPAAAGVRRPPGPWRHPAPGLETRPRAGGQMMSLRVLSVGVVLLEVAIVVVIVLFLIGEFEATTV